jgi:hypothetical protein
VIPVSPYDERARATPSSFPATAGMTSPVARAAPVVVGTMLVAGVRAYLSGDGGPGGVVTSGRDGGGAGAGDS